MTLPSTNIIEMFLEAARVSPNQVAIEFNDQTWTYGELLANVIRTIQELGIKPGDIVYQYVDRSFEMICGLLGIICAGGIYFPVNPTDISLNLSSLMNEIPGRCVIVHEKTSAKFSNTISNNIPVVNIERILLAKRTEEVIVQKIDVQNTNGSVLIYAAEPKCQPKIIQHTHASLTAGLQNLMRWSTDYGNKVLQVAVSSSITHVFEVFIPLTTISKGTLVLLPSEYNSNMNVLCDVAQDKELSILLIDSRTFHGLVENLEINHKKYTKLLESICLIWISNENPDPKYVARIKTLSSNIRIFFMFGMSETNVALGRKIEESVAELEKLNVLPIGSPLEKYQCLLVDNSKSRRIISRSDRDTVGEIYLAGAGLFQCYYKNPEWTNKSKTKVDNREYFKTGHLARYSPKGELILADQVNSEVKLDDSNCDVAKVEKVIKAWDSNAISNCLVTRVSQDENKLVAYISSNHKQLDTEPIRNYCKNTLPESMVPSHFVVLKEFPLDINRKIDRQQLPVPPVQGVRESNTLLNSGSLSFDRTNENSVEDQRGRTNPHNLGSSSTQPVTVIGIPNDDEQSRETDRFLREHNSNDKLNTSSKAVNIQNDNNNNLPFPGFLEKTFYCVKQTTPPRYQCLKLITWPWFERISMIVILINCITLGMHQPCVNYSEPPSLEKCDTIRCLWVQSIDQFVFVFFVVEMCVKMIAMGIIGKGSYLADPWNRLDAFIVMTGVVELFMPGDSLSLSAIRTVRVIRPLRAINRIPSMRILLMLLLDTLPMLTNLLLLCFFIFFIFGVVGVQLWKGLLRNRCFLELDPTAISKYELPNDFSYHNFYNPSEEEPFICSDPSSSGVTKCSDIPKLRQGNMTCELDFRSLNFSAAHQLVDGCINWNQYYQKCTASTENPFSGAIHFDNIAYAWLTIFQIITGEGWAGIMYYVQDAHSFWDWTYFVCLIIIGTYFMMNLCLVVITAQFSVTKKRETERMAAEMKRYAGSQASLNKTKKESFWQRTLRHLRRIWMRTCARCITCHKTKAQISEELNQIDYRTAAEKNALNLNMLSMSDVDEGSLSPLINANHRPGCPFYQLQSLVASTSFPESIESASLARDSHTAVLKSKSAKLNSTINTDRRNNGNLNNDQQDHSLETKVTCTCYRNNDLFDASNNNRQEQDSSLEHRQSEGNGCLFGLKRTQQAIARFIDGPHFSQIIFTAIIINTMLMAIEYHGQPQLLTTILEYCNFFFLVIFTIEMILKIIGGGLFNYVKSPLNILDGSIVIVSLVELYGAGHSGLSVLRTVRLLRILKLVRFMPTLRRQLLIMVKTLDDVAVFLFLLMLFVFIFSVLGMHIFGGRFCVIEGFNVTSDEPFSVPCRCCACADVNLLLNSTGTKDVECSEGRPNFDTLPHALLTVFQILTQEDWNEVLYNGMERVAPSSAVYFIALIVLGNYILINLFVAILVESFQNEGDDTKSTNSLNSNRSDKPDPFNMQAIITGKIEASEELDQSNSAQQKKDLMIVDPVSQTAHSTPSVINDQSVIRHVEVNDCNTNQHTDVNQAQVTQSCCSRLCGPKLAKYFKKREEYSLFLFSPNNKLRQLCQRVIKQQSFDYLILIIIALNCITLAMERPSISPLSFERKFLIYSNYVFTAIFILEMSLKVFSMGLLFGPNTYLRTPSNVMDGFLVVAAIIDVAAMSRTTGVSSTQADSTSSLLGMLRVLRLLRTLRPLTLINRAPGLRLVVRTLLSSLQPIGHIVIICCIFFIIFAILGVQLFKGKLYYCEGPLANTVETREDCEALPHHKWVNQQYNFDNLGHALLTLFVISSKDGWVTIMYTGIDAVDIDKQPKVNHSEGKAFYFIAFLLVISFFVLNMFVGVVVENFHKCRAEIELEEEARRQAKLKRRQERQVHISTVVSYYETYPQWRKRIHDMCVNKYFDMVIVIIIGFNVVTMSIEHYMMSPNLELFLDICNYIFTIIFFIEFLLKLVAFGPVVYFKDSWNQLDSTIVFLSVGSIIVEKMFSRSVFPINPTIIRVIRVLRIARVLRLLKMAAGIRALLDTVIQALPQVGDLSLLFLLLFFIFATLGVELFGKIECSEEQPCSGLSKHANFKNFGIALLTLFRIASGDNWNSIMKDTLQQENAPHGSSSRILNIVSPIYFITFVLVTQFVLVNVVIAVLMKKLEDSNNAAAENDDATDEDPAQPLNSDDSDQKRAEQSVPSETTIRIDS